MIDEKINTLNCDKCDKRECEYSEVKFFIEEINREANSNYEFNGCLDNGGHKSNDFKGTADLYLVDKSKNQPIYAEIKRVFYGYEELNVKIANERSSHALFNIAQGVINWFDEVLKTNEFNKTFSQLYRMDIPNVEFGYSSEREVQDFVNQFSEYIIENYFCNVDKLNNLVEFSFERETKNKEKKIITIKFTKHEINEDNSEGILYAVDATENGSGIDIGELWEKVLNYNCWAKKIINGIGKCQKEKFDSDTPRLKVLILVPRVPTGIKMVLDALFTKENLKERFFNGIINEFNKLFEEMHEKYNYIDKIYFIYTSENYSRKIMLK